MNPAMQSRQSATTNQRAGLCRGPDGKYIRYGVLGVLGGPADGGDPGDVGSPGVMAGTGWTGGAGGPGGEIGGSGRVGT
jgi:hypothetical protein